MFRDMIRINQKMSHEAAEELLNRNTGGVLCCAGDEGYPYGVPMSYAYRDGKIYFHSKNMGYKVDAMAANPKACFTVIDRDDIVAEELTVYYRSVIAFGRTRLLEGEERLDAQWAIVEKYAGHMPKEFKDEEMQGNEKAAVYALDIESMTGKEAIELVGTDL
ncbi:MAG TPA: pyridoxamine 5'-phosphate oxidase family protein [Clostridiales bacterium]|nr:pyridoxamine 5'-phosphate oxidase family protein [Clostridiales bacterium]